MLRLCLVALALAFGTASCTPQRPDGSRALDLITYETYRGYLIVAEGDAGSEVYGIKLVSAPTQVPAFKLRLHPSLEYPNLQELAAKAAYVEVYGYFAANAPGYFLARKLTAVEPELQKLRGVVHKSPGQSFEEAPYFVMMEDTAGKAVRLELALESADLAADARLAIESKQAVTIEGYQDSERPDLFVAVALRR